MKSLFQVFSPFVNRVNQSQNFSGNVQEQSNINMMSFANSFAHYPNPMLSQRPTDANIYELHAVDMSLDALYLHELHNMEVRLSHNPICIES